MLAEEKLSSLETNNCHQVNGEQGTRKLGGQMGGLARSARKG